MIIFCSFALILISGSLFKEPERTADKEFESIIDDQDPKSSIALKASLKEPFPPIGNFIAFTESGHFIAGYRPPSVKTFREGKCTQGNKTKFYRLYGFFL